jgi:hypothetical protein
MVLTPARLAFLRAALVNGGEIMRDRANLSGRIVQYHAGPASLLEQLARDLVAEKLIEPVKIAGTSTTQIIRNDRGVKIGFRYRLTEAGRLAALQDPPFQ